MATFVSVRAKVKGVLDGVAKLAFVDDFHNAKITGYPAATFDISDEDAEFITNKENLRTITFQIVLSQEQKGLGKDNAKRILDQVTIDVIDAFESDFSLGGEVDFCLPLAGERGQDNSGAGAVFFQVLNLQCKFIKLII